MKRLRLIRSCLLALIFTSAGIGVASTGYHLIKSIPLGESDWTWDFQTIDEHARRLYVSHFNEVQVLDIDTGKFVGKIPDTPGVHGVAIAPKVHRGFVSVGKRSSALIFDLKTLRKIDEVKVGANPDAIIYDPATERIFSFNGDSSDATAIESATGKVAGTFNIDGKPEFAISDGKGYVYLDLVDKNVVAKIDARRLEVVSRWPTAPCDRPTSMAADLKNKRLFVGCRNLIMAVFDIADGHFVAQAPIGDNVDTTVFDPGTGLISSSTGDGVITIIHEDSPDKYSSADVVKSHDGSKTMALDPKSHKLFVPSGDVKFLDPEVKGGRPKKTIVPGSAAILVFGK